jgi:hypothetical protein
MSLSEHEQHGTRRDRARPRQSRRRRPPPVEVATPGRAARARRRGGALVLGVLLIGVGLVHPSAAGEAIAVAGYLVIVGAVAAVLDARRRRGLRPAWSRPVAPARQKKHYAATRRRQRPGRAGLDLAAQDQLGQVRLLG